MKVWCDVDLGADLEMAEVEGGWELRLPLPELDRLEYLFDVDGADLVPDPGNPDRSPGAFGDHSWLPLPGYAPPAWLGAAGAAGSRGHVEDTPVGDVDVEVWAPAGADGDEPLPLLIAHDGPEMDAYGGLTHYVGALIGDGRLPRMRVALLAPGERNERYAANPAYAAALVDHVVPRCCRRLPEPPTGRC